MKPNSVVFYRGPSMLTGDPIMAVITGLRNRTHNTKTGPMLQTWILRSDVDPIRAVDTGGDRAICGTCPLRSPHADHGGGRYGRSCYVAWHRAPVNVYKGVLNGVTRELAPAALAPLLQDRFVRVGSYGDPAAVPFEVWDRTLCRIAGWTGYTHQFRVCDQRFRDLLMASVESEAGVHDAQARGWRTFRVRQGSMFRPERGLLEDEIICPASVEAGHRAECQSCRLCRGQASNSPKSIAILAHGRFASAVPA